MRNLKSITRIATAITVFMAAAASAQAADPAYQSPSSPSGAGTPSSGAGAPSSGASYGDDALITTKVKAALSEDKQISGLKINVSTDQGVVKITGNVPSAEIGKHVVERAASVEGVKNVKNDLKVKS